VVGEGEREPLGPPTSWFESKHLIAFLTFMISGLIPLLISMVLLCIRAKQEPIKLAVPSFIPFALFFQSLVLVFVYCFVALSAWAFHQSALRPRGLPWSAFSGLLTTLTYSFWDAGLYLLAFLWPFLGPVVLVPSSPQGVRRFPRRAWLLLCLTNVCITATVVLFRIIAVETEPRR